MKTGLQIHSTVRSDGNLEVTLEDREIAPLGADEVLIRIEATPMNPSDLGPLFSLANMEQATNEERNGRIMLRAPIPDSVVSAVAARVDQSLPIGNEGAGVVIEAGESSVAQALLGKTVAFIGGAMFAEYRTAPAASCLLLPTGTSAREAASCFVNPLTALGMIETMRLENHSALIHTAAGSNLGQMLNRLCLVDGVPLVNVVRSQTHVKQLREAGAKHVCNSSEESFVEDLCQAIADTGATLAFDAVGGGDLASKILSAMERVAGENLPPANRYGSTVHKQVYLYGMLDPSATLLDRSYGMAWGVGGWLMPNFLARIGVEKAQALRERVAREVTTIFSSHYDREISLFEALDVDIARDYLRKATGAKVLINPHKDRR